MKLLEKLIFLEITNYQFTKFHSKDFYKTYELLSETEKDKFTDLTKEIHQMYTLLNSPPVLNATRKYHSVADYLTEFEVSPIILKVLNDFNLDLKNVISDEIKNLIISKFGEEYFNENFGT